MANAPATRISEPVPDAMPMVQMLAGFQMSQALYVVAKLGVATALLDGPLPVTELAERTAADADSLMRIVRVLAPMGVFTTDGDQISITPFGTTLAEGLPYSVRDVALFWMETHYAPFGELLHTARTGQSAATHHYGETFFDWITKSPELVSVLTNAMASITNGLRAGMFDGYTLPAGNVVADLGGADGSMLATLLAGDPDRRGIVFDRPEVVPTARKVLADAGLADRVETVGGDFFVSVPAADVYVLSYIVHDWDDESCRRILRTVAEAAQPGARVVLVEAVIPDGDNAHLAKVTDLAMLAMVTGRERTTEQYEQLLDRAGFTLDRIVTTPSPFCFIEATLH